MIKEILKLKVVSLLKEKKYMFSFSNFKWFSHNHQSGEVDFTTFYTLFQSSSLRSNDHLSTFGTSFSSMSVVSGCQSPVGHTHLVLSILSSLWPFSRFCVLQSDRFGAFFFFFAVLHLCLSFWMCRCENHGPSRGQVENRICSLRMQRGKKVGEREGWMDEGREGVWGCIWCEALQRRVWESKPTMANLMLRPLVNLKASIRQPVFGRILHPVVFFLPTFAFSHSLFGALLRVQPKNLKELSRSPIVKTFSYAFTWVQCQLLLFKMRCVIFLKISLQAVLEGKYPLCLCDVAKGCGSFAYISKFLSCWYNL